MKNPICFRLLLATVFLVVSTALYSQNPQNYYVRLNTKERSLVIKLYNEIPLHRDNFVKLVEENFYDSLLFHRVIQNFMIQGGDPDSRYAGRFQQLGNGGLDYRIKAEFIDSLIHRKGALGAARDNNPDKESSSTQFYIVQGRSYTNEGLDSLEQFRLKKNLSDLQRKVYTGIGGAPHLDGAYTVFGQVIDGLPLVDTIASLPTDDHDRPLEDVRMSMVLLNRGEALDIELGKDGKHRKKGFFGRIFGKNMDGPYTLK